MVKHCCCCFFFVVVVVVIIVICVYVIVGAILYFFVVVVVIICYLLLFVQWLLLLSCLLDQSNQFNLRDLKPENCLLASNGYLKLVDLGLAKRLKVILSFGTLSIDPPSVHHPYTSPAIFPSLSPSIHLSFIIMKRRDDEHSACAELQNMSHLKSYDRCPVFILDRINLRES